jgi:hypothetical protein
MGLRINPNESYEEWANRARMSEYGIALQRIAKGDPADIVLDDMGRRLMDKLTYPLYKMINNHANINFTSSKLEYEKIMKDVGKASDHVLDE